MHKYIKILLLWLLGLCIVGCTASVPRQKKDVVVPPSPPQMHSKIHIALDNQAILLPDNVQAMQSWCDRRVDLATQRFEKFEAFKGEGTETKMLLPFDRLLTATANDANVASFYYQVHPQKELRDVAAACASRFSKWSTMVSLSRPIYDLVTRVQSDDKDTQRFLKRLLRDFRRSGVSASEEKRTQIAQLRSELTELGQQFSRNINDDVRYIWLEKNKHLAGLPEDYITSLPREQKGYRVSTDYPLSIPFMRYAENDTARFILHRKSLNRGYPKNKTVLKKILVKRYELAQLLGYDHYADYAMETLMSGSAQRVEAFIEQINELARPRSDRDYALLLKKLHATHPRAKNVGRWRHFWLTEKIKAEKYNIKGTEVRSYFPYEKVKTGLLQLTQNLFGVQIRPWKDAVLWHDSVEAYEVLENGKMIGRFYLDMHPRTGKYKHAAHFTLRTGIKGKQLPVSALVCNFPHGDELMEHRQVETFFHEFGHLLHSLFGGHQRWSDLSGIATEHDFVEAPSQMFEEWAWDPKVLQTFAVNAQGQRIPADLVRRMRAARDFGLGAHIRNQMFYASLSLQYYNKPPQEVSLTDDMIALQKQYSPFPYVPKTYFYANFGHLFGYSAVYYTYMWSEVIAADMFEVFRRKGLLNQQLARRYMRDVLGAGGSLDAADIVERFLGRPYNDQAFRARLNQSQ